MERPPRKFPSRWKDKDEVRAAREAVGVDVLEEAYADPSVDKDLYASMKREDYRDWAAFNARVERETREQRAKRQRRLANFRANWKGPWPFDWEEYVSSPSARRRINNLIMYADYSDDWHRDARRLREECWRLID